MAEIRHFPATSGMRIAQLRAERSRKRCLTGGWSMTGISKSLAGLALGFGLAGFATSAHAVLVTDGPLTLNTNPSQIFQQTEAAPCVIGGNNCLNGSFPMTIQNGGGGGTLNSNILSPVYQVSAIT